MRGVLCPSHGAKPSIRFILAFQKNNSKSASGIARPRSSNVSNSSSTENPNGELHEIALAAKTIRMLQVEKLGYPRICSASRLAFNAVTTEARAVPTKVLLVDYSGVVLTGIQRLLANYPDISVVGAVPTLEEGIRLAEEFHPDVTVFDLSMSDRGPSARKQTQTLIASSKKVLCISLLREDDVSPLLAAIGVSQYVDKVNLSQELPDAIRKAPQVGKPNIT